METMNEDSGDEWDEQLLTDLYEIHCNPLNLNGLTKEGLEQLPFLTDVQILDILSYVQQHRPVLSTGELMFINSLNYSTRRALQLFVYAGSLPSKTLSFKETLRHLNSELTVRTDIPIQTKMGFASYSAETLEKNPNIIYRGTQPYHALRYAASIPRRLDAGFQLEKDVGERGIDNFSAYAVLKDMGRLRRIAVGDYRLSLGQGLVVNTSSGFGKTMMLNSVGRLNRGIRRHSSIMEDGYFRGVATTLQLHHDLQATAFFSHRHIDGTLLADSSGVSNLKTDGLHRTLLERSKRGNMRRTDLGGNLNLQLGQIKLSTTVAYTHLSLPLLPLHNTPATRYRLYDARGTDFTTYGIAYRYNLRDWNICGETAIDKNGHIATLNTLQGKWLNHQFTLIQRYYQARFISMNGKSFGENSRPQNESGLYLGWNYALTRRSQLQAYTDIMYFPWLKYQVSNRSWGIDAMAQFTHTSRAGHLFNIRYRIKSKQKDYNIGSESTPVTELWFNTVQSLRTNFTTQLSPTLSTRSTLAIALVTQGSNTPEKGYSIDQQIRWKKQALDVSLSATYFHTDSYVARTYGYEPSLLYSFGLRAYYYHGCRVSLLVQLPLTHRLRLIAKATSTRFFDRSSIGTGLDLIPHRHREDLQLQIQWKF